jgi:hypothetical protein
LSDRELHRWIAAQGEEFDESVLTGDACDDVVLLNVL